MDREFSTSASKYEGKLDFGVPSLYVSDIVYTLENMHYDVIEENKNLGKK